ncbi:MAG: XRE family transcriptional regulator [Spirochaetaceae bacterium]|jgi:DNA-binding Xre family transcriptional regulator|nr:XRE family transcriptional regulator [Spirochaetaceae bacterium]
METTFKEFITDDQMQKKLFDKEYNEFLLKEFVLEKMAEEKLSVRKLARNAHVSPTVIQKIRSKNADRITFNTFMNVVNSLGYGVKLERI